MFAIAIDGPAGAGKSTIAKLAAKKLDFLYVDTGALYRAMALYLINHQIDEKNEDAVTKVCPQIDVSLTYREGNQEVILNGKDVSADIRTEKVSMVSSVISSYAAVRACLLNLQRDIAQKNNVIMDGRDIGTCVLPQADLKIFLTASFRERANRRYKEQKERGISCDPDQIYRDIVQRDKQDETRKIAPLKQAEDAILLDATDLSIEEVTDKVISLYRERV